MSIKREIDKAVNNTKDTVNEVRHRSNAEGEKAKREVVGDAMTPGEKVGSAVNEGAERTKAGIDSLKRTARKNT